MAPLPPLKKRRIVADADRKISAPKLADADRDGLQDSAFAKGASRWNLEQTYEKKGRGKAKEKSNLRLPIKHANGIIEQVNPEKATEESANESESDAEPLEEVIKDESVSSPKPQLSHRAEIAQAKEELARIAALINEDPEEHIGSLRRLSDFTTSTNSVVIKLSLAAQAAVFKDIIPGYRIRPLEDEVSGTKLSKDVRRQRNFEQTVVHRYQQYVKELAKLAKPTATSSSKSASAELASVAISCACNLLRSVPHFNFRGDILNIIVGRLASRRVDKDFSLCLETVQHIYQTDETGNASLEATSVLSKMIKAKRFQVNEAVLNLFLNLRLLSEFGHRASNRAVDSKDDDTQDRDTFRNRNKKREYRSKKERKLAKANKAIEKEMQEADAAVSYEDRDRMQSETLKLVFSVYFRILKDRTPHLMAPVLEGLVKYAHLINQEFFGDILESLKDLISQSEAMDNNGAEIGAESTQETETKDGQRDATRESLLCVITAFALLQGQDASAAASTLHLDLSFFIGHLYKALHATSMHPDIEWSTKSLHLPDPNAAQPNIVPQTKVNVQTTIVLLIRSLQAVMLPETVRSVPPIRLAAFTKQLATIALQLPEKSSTAILGLLNEVMKMHNQKVARLWNTEERQGDGVFEPLRGDLESSRPFAASIWEGELLRLHFCPQVRDGLRNLESRSMPAKN